MLPVAAIAVALAGGCGADDSAICLTNDGAEVCATPRDGAIEFRGSGLAPGSSVLIESTRVGESVYRVDDDGTFEPGGRGVLSFITGTPFTFTVSATTSDGNALDGQIIVGS